MRTRLSLSVAVLAAVLSGLLLAGCGGAGDGGGSGAQPEFSATGGQTVSNAPSASSPSTGSPSASRPTGASGKQPPTVAITGTPTEGVENGCIVMQSGTTLYLLLGGDRSALMSGRPVVVRGTPAPGLMTTCQQGTPFQVAEVTPA